MPRSRRRKLRRGETLENFKLRGCEVYVKKRRRCGNRAQAYFTSDWAKWGNGHDDMPQPKWYCNDHAKELIPQDILLDLLKKRKEARDAEIAKAEFRRRVAAKGESKLPAAYVADRGLKAPKEDQDRGRKTRHGTGRVVQTRTVNRGKAVRGKGVRKEGG